MDSLEGSKPYEITSKTLGGDLLQMVSPASKRCPALPCPALRRPPRRAAPAGLLSTSLTAPRPTLACALHQVFNDHQMSASSFFNLQYEDKKGNPGFIKPDKKVGGWASPCTAPPPFFFFFSSVAPSLLLVFMSLNHPSVLPPPSLVHAGPLPRPEEGGKGRAPQL